MYVGCGYSGYYGHIALIYQHKLQFSRLRRSLMSKESQKSMGSVVILYTRVFVIELLSAWFNAYRAEMYICSSRQNYYDYMPVQKCAKMINVLINYSKKRNSINHSYPLMLYLCTHGTVMNHSEKNSSIG